MSWKGYGLLVWFSCLFFATASIATEGHGGRDRTASCLRRIDWERDAFGTLDDFDEIFVYAQAFDTLVACAYPSIESTAEKRVAHPPTIFVRADARDDAVGRASTEPPVARIIHRGISYVRSPEFPGVCDALRANAIRYAWCAGERGPWTRDAKLIACENEYCDFSVWDTRRRFGAP